MSKAEQIAVRLTGPQRQLVALLDGERWAGPAVPSAFLGRLKHSLTRKGLLERQVSRDNCDGGIALHRLTPLGLQVRALLLERSTQGDQ